MNKKHQLSQSEQRIFKEAMQGVKPLKQGNHAPPYKNRKTPSFHANNEFIETNADYMLSDGHEFQTINSNEAISYRSNGVQAKQLKKLRTGKIDSEGRLDLHGLTLDQARQYVSNFIFDSQMMDKKCVIIIHGKGSVENPAIMKSMLNHWLQQISDVLAFCSAQPQHGGNGAVYVLLKSKPSNNQ